MAKRQEEVCRNCRQNFQLGDGGRHVKRLPFLLQCGHTLCSVCIAKAKRNSDVISCNDCGAKTPFNSAEPPETQLVPDVYTLGRVAAKHLKLKCTPSQREQARLPWWNGRETMPELEELPSVVDPRCDECGGVAVKRCIQCDGFFCDTCFKVVHAAANILRKHRSVPAYQAGSPLPTCSEHPSNPLAYYCSTDRVAVCSDCFMKSHKAHDIVSIEEAAKGHRSDFERLVKDSQSTMEAIRTKKQGLCRLLEEAGKQSLVTAQSVELQMRELFTLLQKRQLALHSELSQTVDQQVAPLLDMEKSLDEDISRVSGIVTRTRECLKCDVKLLQNADQLYEALREVQEMKISDLPLVPHISFELSPDVKETINGAGSFTANSTSEHHHHHQKSTDISLAELNISKLSPSCSGSVSPAPGRTPSPAPVVHHHLPSSSSRSPSPLFLHPELQASMRSSLSPRAQSKRSSSRGSSRQGSRHSSRCNTPVTASVPAKREETVGVWVSHVATPTEFYIQFKDEEEHLHRVSYDLNEEFPKGQLSTSDITEGMKVAALFGSGDDEMWYRAEVMTCYLSSSPAYVEVIYLDYGNTDNVPLAGLARLPVELECGPFYAHSCALSAIQPPSKFSNVAPLSWSPKCVTNFKNIVDFEGSLQTEVVMKENRRNVHNKREVDIYTVTVEGGLKSVASTLVKMGLAAWQTQEPVAGRMIPPPLPLTKTTQCREVIMSSCTSPSNFYVQLVKSDKLLKSVMISIKAQNKHKIVCVYKGLVCIAQHSKKYYRAVITDVHDGGGGRVIEVRCVDYGDVECVKEVWELDHQNLTLPAQAFYCELHNVLPLEGHSCWPQEVNEWFKDAVCTGTVLMETASNSTGEPLSVRLFDKSTQQPIDSIMVKEGLARYGASPVASPQKTPNTTKKSKKKRTKPPSTPTVTPPTPKTTLPPSALLSPLSQPLPPHGQQSPLMKPSVTPSDSLTKPQSPRPVPPPSLWPQPLAVGAKLDCVVVQVSSPGEFFIQPPDYMARLHPKLSRIPLHQPSRPTWKTGERCLASFQGEKWYRGEVLGSAGGSLYEVLYLDFGNSAIVESEDLAVLPSALASYPPCAVKTELAGVLPVGEEWSHDVSLVLSNLVLGKRVLVTVQEFSADSTDMRVFMHVDGYSVADVLLSTQLVLPDPSLYPLPTSSLSSFSSSSSDTEKPAVPPSVGEDFTPQKSSTPLPEGSEGTCLSVPPGFTLTVSAVNSGGGGNSCKTVNGLAQIPLVLSSVNDSLGRLSPNCRSPEGPPPPLYVTNGLH